MATILYGAPVKEKLKQALIDRIKGFKKKPCLAIVQVGDREDSSVYIKQKQKFGEEIGVRVILEKFDQQIREEELVAIIQKLNDDQEIDGIIVQLPLPPDLDSQKIVSLIKKSKDADGLSPLGDLGEETLVTPATARGVLALLDFYNIKIEGKKVAVLGRSKLAGGPIAEVLKKRGATVSVCHRETEWDEKIKICREADILISATGQVGLVTGEFVREGQVVVDVGINRTPSAKEITPLTPLTLRGEPEKPKIVGDVVFEEVEPLVAAITPVPGGIGPLTVACLFENLLDLC